MIKISVEKNTYMKKNPRVNCVREVEIAITKEEIPIPNNVMNKKSSNP